jgi:large subunit ribosomal protein L10
MVRDYKVKAVDEVAEKIKSARTFGIADLGRLPSNQMHTIRKFLRGKAEIRMLKRSLLKKAIERAGAKGMEENIKGAPVVITSSLDAFQLFREIKSQRMHASAKPGMIAPVDVVVKEGGTGLPPGQAIGDLQNAGIPAKIERGQIVVIKETILVKAGHKVNATVANALAKLDLKPFEIGLDVAAIKEGEIIFPSQVLDVNIEQIRAQFTSASSEAFSLAYQISYPVKDVIEMRLAEIAGQAKSLAVELEWETKEVMPELISKANAQAILLKKKTGGV